jgi:hypothetical protein
MHVLRSVENVQDEKDVAAAFAKTKPREQALPPLACCIIMRACTAEGGTDLSGVLDAVFKGLGDSKSPMSVLVITGASCCPAHLAG